MALCGHSRAQQPPIYHNTSSVSHPHPRTQLFSGGRALLPAFHQLPPPCPSPNLGAPSTSYSHAPAQRCRAHDGGAVGPLPAPGDSVVHKLRRGVVIVDHGSRKKDSNDMLLDFCR